MALAALALVVFGAYDSYPIREGGLSLAPTSKERARSFRLLFIATRVVSLSCAFVASLIQYSFPYYNELLSFEFWSLQLVSTVTDRYTHLSTHMICVLAS